MKRKRADGEIISGLHGGRTVSVWLPEEILDLLQEIYPKADGHIVMRAIIMHTLRNWCERNGRMDRYPDLGEPKKAGNPNFGKGKENPYAEKTVEGLAAKGDSQKVPLRTEVFIERTDYAEQMAGFTPFIPEGLMPVTVWLKHA